MVGFAVAAQAALSLSQAAFVNVSVDWDASFRNVYTAATVEVDVMPQLARDQNQSGFEGYMRALEDLGASYVRFAPWFGYPRVVVPEFEKTNCSAGGSTWNSTLLDGVIKDFMTAVCGPNAAAGECIDNRSVAPQLSTMPMWLYKSDGINRTHDFPSSSPWAYVPGHLSHYAAHGTPLLDPSCKEMAAYAARYVGYYTAGGFTDECGVSHNSGLHYKWPLLSVLNEDEYGTPPGGGVQYTICWDAWKAAIGKVNPNITLIGPEIADLNYALYFMNKSNHADNQPPPVVSTHVWISAPDRSGSFDGLFPGVDTWLAEVADPLDASRSPELTELVMNEFIPNNNAWCNTSLKPRCNGDTWKWASASTARAGTDRTTLGWNAAAAAFAYAYGRLAERGWKYVGADQLIGGPYPNNEAGVASLDWDTGSPNAKYYAVQMLASELGAGEKALYNASSSSPSQLYALGLGVGVGVGVGVDNTRSGGTGSIPASTSTMHHTTAPLSHMLLLVSKTASPTVVHIDNARGATFTAVDGIGPEPGWQPPRRGVLAEDGRLTMGAYGFALLSLSPHGHEKYGELTDGDT